MKKLLLLLLLLCALCSCSLDLDDKQEEAYVAFATVENPNATPKFHLLLDDGTKFYTAEVGELANPDEGYPKDGRRVLINYSIVKPESNINIKLRNLTNVPLGIISIENSSRRNDRHRLEMLYPGGADFLNVLMSHNYTSSTNVQHDILLVKKELRADEAEFDLIYSNNGDLGTEFGMSSISFDLSSLKEQYPDSIKLVVNTFETSAETPKAYTMKYKWK